MPQRIQRKRVKGWRLPANAMSVTRPGRYGNPYKIGDKNDNGELVTAEMCLEYYEFYLKRRYPGDALKRFLAPLRGKDLACFCPLDQPCHVDVLLKL